MNDLLINYSISKKLKAFVFLSGLYLFCTSVGISVFQAMGKHYSFFFFVGIVGIVLAAILILSVTVWQAKPILILNNEQLLIHLPKQKIDGEISWENVTQLGIGLSFITMETTENRNYKVDLENLKYSDLRAIKTKLIEICEAKGIPYKNL